MTKKAYLKHRNIMEAWAHGKEIQYKDPETGYWVSIENPGWAEELEYRVKPKATFPIYVKCKTDNHYLRFDTEFEAEVIGVEVGKSSEYSVGYKSDDWISVFDSDLWEIIEDPYKLHDKDPVICQNSSDMATRHIAFFDAKNNCTFTKMGLRRGPTFDYYKKILPWEEFDWIKEMRKYLED